MNAIIKAFNEYFSVVPARSLRLRDEVFRLRYQVYCLEKGFEKAEFFPEGLETDRYDNSSVHSLLRHKPSGQYAGTVRLILADDSNPDRPFPIEQYVRHHVSVCGNTSSRTSTMRLAEISRLAITQQFQHRCTDITPRGDLPAGMVPGEHRHFPHIILGLYMAIVRMTVERDVTHWYAMMEPALARLLGRFGIYFQAIGPLVDHNGRRRPYFGSVEDVMSGIYLHRPEIWDLLTESGTLLPAPKLSRVSYPQVDPNSGFDRIAL